jgi:hypothetical protein
MHPTKKHHKMEQSSLVTTNTAVGRGLPNRASITKPPEHFLLDQISSTEVVGIRSGLVGERIVQRISAVIRQNKFKTVWVALADDAKTELAEFKCGAMYNVTFEYRFMPEGDRGCVDKEKSCYIGWATGELININQKGAYVPLDVACHLKSLMYDNVTGRFFDKENMDAKFSRADLVVFYPDGGARHFNARS